MARLKYLYGTMSSQKSARLIMTHYALTEQDKKVIVFKPDLDTRDGEYVQSRALNTKVKALLIGQKQVNKMLNILVDSNYDIVLADEINFFQPYHIDELRLIVDKLNINVECYGLLTDFQRNLFPSSKRLLELADKTEEVKSGCVDCSNKATVNMRLKNGQPVFDGEQIQVGGNEFYKAVCHKCYAKYKGGM